LFNATHAVNGKMYLHINFLIIILIIFFFTFNITLMILKRAKVYYIFLSIFFALLAVPFISVQLILGDTVWLILSLSVCIFWLSFISNSKKLISLFENLTLTGFYNKETRVWNINYVLPSAQAGSDAYKKAVLFGTFVIAPVLTSISRISSGFEIAISQVLGYVMIFLFVYLAGNLFAFTKLINKVEQTENIQLVL
jgi:hypothetical protein